MANTYTPNVQLAMPAPGDRTWNVPVNGNAQVLDALAPVACARRRHDRGTVGNAQCSCGGGKLSEAGWHDRQLCRVRVRRQ